MIKYSSLIGYAHPKVEIISPMLSFLGVVANRVTFSCYPYGFTPKVVEQFT